MEWFIQFIALLLVFFIAAVRSLRFDPNDLTTFELERQAKRGVDAALTEQTLRKNQPLLLSLQRLVALLLSLLLIVLLATVFAIGWAILWSLLWLLVAELLEARPEIRNVAEKYAQQYRQYIYKVIEFLHVPLSFMADKQLLRAERRATFYSKEELLEALAHDRTVLSKEEKTFIRQSLAYESIKIKDVMTPRSVVVFADSQDTLGPVVLDRLHKSGQSRFPVVNKDLDHIVGMLYMHELVSLNPKIKYISDIMSDKVYYVSEDKTLDHALHAFLRTRCHLFIVVNEFEETTGVISIEDVIETIIGRKIVDEFDQYEDLRAVAKLAAIERQKAKAGKHID